MLKTTGFHTGVNTCICLHYVMYVILSVQMFAIVFPPTLTALKGLHGMHFTNISFLELPFTLPVLFPEAVLSFNLSNLPALQYK